MSKCFEERGSWTSSNARCVLSSRAAQTARKPGNRSSASALDQARTLRHESSRQHDAVCVGEVPRRLCGSGGQNPLLARQQLTQHEREYPAMPVVINFNRSIDPQLHWNGFAPSIFARYLECDHLPRFDCV